MKVVFLDIDGVLCLWESFDPTCMANLKRIWNSTGAAIVLTSTWRLSENQRKMFIDEGLMPLGIQPPVGQTPDFRAGGYDRPDEILDWLGDHREVRQWVAIDDHDLLTKGGNGGKLAGHFVQTDRWTGITDRVACDAIGKLQR